MIEKTKEIFEEIKENKEIKKQEEIQQKIEEKKEEIKQKWIEEVINEKEKKFSFGYKLNKLFDKIEFLSLEKEEKAEVALNVKKNATPDRLYWLEIFLSWIIASLWLLQNSVAVIIGAMLIAPFLRPINGISFAIARWEKKFFFNSLKVFFLSSIFSVWMWFAVINITWLYKETPEILARISPNIIDFFIAVFSAMVALLSLRYKRLWESVAWVAMAASLMPPLWVIGMELALGNFHSAWWATMLFIANIIAIIFVGIFSFWLYGFTPNDWWKQKKSFIRIFSVIFIISIISFPLLKNFFFIKDRNVIEQKIKNNLSLILDKKINNFEISKLKIKELSKKNIKLKLELKIPEWIKFYNYYTDFLNKSLTDTIWRNVEVEIDITRKANILSKKDEELKQKQELELKEKLKNKTKKQQEEYMNNLKKDFKQELEEELDQKLRDEIKKDLEEKMKKDLNEKINFLLKKQKEEKKNKKLSNSGSIKDLGK